eukprot:CAMPEP_0167758124 /NCGR_PEP_ID=MMETSP0110_2-20121227/10296_1 /TAXON_ID=629695 /ORGANISM="Gymnochlora sp., Strain CCMP2014" /LENGTH=970 /DNA_ID=CAMNT_0007644369 /DNA_START=1 /DNA_END=2914 /DNA_ORIENTATION=-
MFIATTKNIEVWGVSHGETVNLGVSQSDAKVMEACGSFESMFAHCCHIEEKVDDFVMSVNHWVIVITTKGWICIYRAMSTSEAIEVQTPRGFIDKHTAYTPLFPKVNIELSDVVSPVTSKEKFIAVDISNDGTHLLALTSVSDLLRIPLRNSHAGNTYNSWMNTLTSWVVGTKSEEIKSVAGIRNRSKIGKIIKLKLYGKYNIYILETGVYVATDNEVVKADTSSEAAIDISINSNRTFLAILTVSHVLIYKLPLTNTSNPKRIKLHGVFWSPCKVVAITTSSHIILVHTRTGAILWEMNLGEVGVLAWAGRGEYSLFISNGSNKMLQIDFARFYPKLGSAVILGSKTVYFLIDEGLRAFHAPAKYLDVAWPLSDCAVDSDGSNGIVVSGEQGFAVSSLKSSKTNKWRVFQNFAHEAELPRCRYLNWFHSKVIICAVGSRKKHSQNPPVTIVAYPSTKLSAESRLMCLTPATWSKHRSLADQKNNRGVVTGIDTLGDFMAVCLDHAEVILFRLHHIEDIENESLSAAALSTVNISNLAKGSPVSQILLKLPKSLPKPLPKPKSPKSRLSADLPSIIGVTDGGLSIHAQMAYAKESNTFSVISETTWRFFRCGSLGKTSDLEISMDPQRSLAFIEISQDMKTMLWWALEEKSRQRFLGGDGWLTGFDPLTASLSFVKMRTVLSFPKNSEKNDFIPPISRPYVSSRPILPLILKRSIDKYGIEDTQRFLRDLADIIPGELIRSGLELYLYEEIESKEKCSLKPAVSLLYSCDLGREIIVECMRKVQNPSRWQKFFEISGESPVLIFWKLMEMQRYNAAGQSLHLVLRVHGLEIAHRCAATLQISVQDNKESSELRTLLEEIKKFKKATADELKREKEEKLRNEEKLRKENLRIRREKEEKENKEKLRVLNVSPAKIFPPKILTDESHESRVEGTPSPKVSGKFPSENEVEVADIAQTISENDNVTSAGCTQQ